LMPVLPTEGAPATSCPKAQPAAAAQPPHNAHQ
jgi:hypothetical protein